MPHAFKLLAAAAAFSLSLGFAPSAEAVESGTYKLDNEHASVIWSVQHLGLSNYTGRFDSFSIDLTLNAEDPTKSAVSASIDPTSVNTGFPGEKDFNGEVAKDQRFLNAPAHPVITFVSTAVEPTGETTAKITGDLTLLGVTKQVVLDAEIVGAIDSHPFRKVPAIGFRAETSIDRTEFGMTFLSNALGNGAPVVSPEVRIVINAEFFKVE